MPPGRGSLHSLRSIAPRRIAAFGARIGYLQDEIVRERAGPSVTPRSFFISVLIVRVAPRTGNRSSEIERDEHRTGRPGPSWGGLVMATTNFKKGQTAARFG